MKPRRLAESERRTLTLPITALGRHGEGFALFDGGKAFVPGALPGDTATFRIEEEVDRKTYRGTLLTIDAAGGQRAAPPCRHFEECGGCALQHMNDGAYRLWKSDRMRGLLRQAGLEPGVWDDPVFIPGGTRRRADFAAFRRGGRLYCGFNARRSQRIAAIDECLVLHPRVKEALDRSRPFLARLLPDGGKADLFIQTADGQCEAVVTGLRTLSLKDRETLAEWLRHAGLRRIALRPHPREECEISVQQGPLSVRFGPLAVHVPPGTFLQPSAEGERAIVAAMLSMLPARASTIADLYAGCGTLTGALLERGRVHAVEYDLPALNALKLAGAGHSLTAEVRNLERSPLAAEELKRYDAVVLDPPRAGAAAQAAALARSAVPSVVYISCKPEAFVRDARVLAASGFRLKRAALIDQFTWSPHTELVALLERA